MLEAIIIVVLALVGAWFGGRGVQKSKQKQKALEDEKDRIEKGRNAVHDGRNDSLDDSLRKNDGRWM